LPHTLARARPHGGDGNASEAANAWLREHSAPWAARLTVIEAPTRCVGTTQLRTVLPGTAENRRLIEIGADAYPVLKLDAAARDAAFERSRERALREPESRSVGAYREGRLVGGMRVYDFWMNVRGTQLFTGGVGAVAVALEHKQSGIARDLIRGFLDEYRERGAALAALYPFRPDFYRKLGFGYGTKMHQYRIALGALPAGGQRDRVRRLGPGDLDIFLAAYERFAQAANGLFRRESWRAAATLADDALRTYGYEDANGLGGYLTFDVRLGEAGTTNRNDLYVHELIYETPAALAALLAFARSQRDQFATLIVNTQDPDFHAMLDDPRNGSDRILYPPAYHETNTQGVGIMYRLIDVAAFVAALGERTTFGTLDATVRIALRDAFFEPNSGAYTIRFDAGRPRMAALGTPADVDLAIEVADFSSLVMGAVRLRSLVAYGRAVLSNHQWLTRLDAAFDAPPPQCLTRF
jgi:predicted acetyltransferase